MITITRQMTKNAIKNIEDLKVILFEGEVNAHKFVIEPTDGISFSGYSVTAKFVRPDDTNVTVAGNVTNGNANLTLTAGCYQATGYYKLFIYVVKENVETVCIYACTGPVVSTVGQNGQAPVPDSEIETYSDELVEDLTDRVEALEAAALQNIKDGTGNGAIIEGLVVPYVDELEEIDDAPNSAPGNYAHAEGYRTTASGNISHAEGGYTISSGAESHAEGMVTQSSGKYSHAEGRFSQSTGQSSHAEGDSSTSSGGGSHAEGNNTVSSGAYSHAEGKDTTASGYTSHAEGYETIANHKCQHVFGEYNVADASASAATTRGAYVEIVGNGTLSNARSNARTLDWSGNESLAGGLTLGKGGSDEADVPPAKMKTILAAIEWLFYNRRFAVTAENTNNYNKFVAAGVTDGGKAAQLFVSQASRTFTWNGTKWEMDDGTELTDQELAAYGLDYELGPNRNYDTFTVTRMDATAAFQTAMKSLAGIRSIMGTKNIEDAMAAANLRHWWKNPDGTIAYKNLTFTRHFNEITINGTYTKSDYEADTTFDVSVSDDLEYSNGIECHMLIQGGHEYKMMAIPISGTAKDQNGNDFSSIAVYLIHDDEISEGSGFSYGIVGAGASISPEYGEDRVFKINQTYRFASLCLKMPDVMSGKTFTFTNMKFRVTLADVTGFGFEIGSDPIFLE